MVYSGHLRLNNRLRLLPSLGGGRGRIRLRGVPFPGRSRVLSGVRVGRSRRTCPDRFGFCGDVVGWWTGAGQFRLLDGRFPDRRGGGDFTLVQL